MTADILLSLGQGDVRDDITLFRVLARSGATKDQLQEIWYGILALIEDEKERYPKELHPDVFFTGRTVFGNRGTRPMVRLYLNKVQRFLDASSTKNLPR